MISKTGGVSGTVTGSMYLVAIFTQILAVALWLALQFTDWSVGLQLAVALPAVASLPIAASGRSPNLREGVTLLTAAAVLALVVSAVPVVLAGQRPDITLVEFLPGLALTFRLEPLGMIFALVASCLWLFTSLYSIGYMHGDRGYWRFFTYVSLFVFSMCMLVLVSNGVGVLFREWKGCRPRTLLMISLSLLVLVGSVLLLTYGSYLGEQGTP